MSKKQLIIGIFIIFILIILSYVIYQSCKVKPDGLKPASVGSIEAVNIAIADSSRGNNDGELNPNETVGLRLKIKNTGQVPIPASEGRIFSGQRGINIVDSTAAIPEIPVGGTVSASEEFIVMVDETATDECAAFLLTLNTINPGDEITKTTSAVEINYSIYVCVDSCALIPLEGSKDILMIRLSICNRSTTSPNPPLPPSPASLPDVAVRILANTIRICTTGSPLSTVPTPVMEPVPSNPDIPLNMVFYGTIASNNCGDPVTCPVTGPNVQEFRFEIDDGSLGTPSCFWFSAEIWLNAVRSDTNCSITLPTGTAKRTITVYARI